MTPAYVLNPALMKLTWNPESWQITQFFNPNYLNSLWLGTVWNVVLLPTRLWQEVLMPTLRAGPMIGLTMLANVVASTLRFAWWGIRGRARPLPVPLTVLFNSYIASEDEAKQMIENGNMNGVSEIKA